jgi:hypothetical protein
MPVPKGVALMSRLRVNAAGISIDGYGAGLDQDLDNPMGVGGMAMHKWVFGTTEHVSTDDATHVVLTKQGRDRTAAVTPAATGAPRA